MLPIYDYMFYSKALEDMDLVTWISCCTQMKCKTAVPAQPHGDTDETLSVKNGADGDLPELEEDSEFEFDESKSISVKFMSEHPLFANHATCCVAPNDAKVPNLLGPGLPQ